jgi:dihydrofolate reductase
MSFDIVSLTVIAGRLTIYLKGDNFVKIFSMRKIVSGFAASVDGYIEGPNAEYDWIIIDKEIDFAEQMKPFDTFLFGRRTYEAALKMAGKRTPGITNYVFSNTLETVHENFELVKGDIKEKVLRMKEQEGKDIALFGGARLLASLLDLRLVDEIVISYIPVLLGKGRPMVDVLNEKVWLSLSRTHTYSNGTLKAFYDVRYSQ